MLTRLAVAEVVDSVKRRIELIVVARIESTCTSMLSVRCSAGIVRAVEVFGYRVLTADRVNDHKVTIVKGGRTAHRCDIDVHDINVDFSVLETAYVWHLSPFLLS